MNTVSRRNFIAGLAAAAGALAAGRNAFGSPSLSSNSKPFQMLVMGDSLISAQGLRPENKFYTLVRNWLRDDLFAGTRQVQMKVKAHSGSRISLHKFEKVEMEKLGDDANRFHHPEINLSFPCIGTQLETAKAEYSDPATVDLILMSGGITDVLVANIVNPFVNEQELIERIDRYCGGGMTGLLEKTASAFPNARIAVIGYFPIISTKSDVKQIARYLFKAIKFPHPLQLGFTNPASRQFLKIMRKKMADRSAMWVSRSNDAFRNAIGSINSTLDSDRILFVETPITGETCFATKRPLLWQTDHDNRPADEMFAARRSECSKAFDEIKYQHYGKLTVRMCELAAIGHPNREGSIAYAEAIKDSLRPHLELDRMAKAA